MKKIPILFTFLLLIFSSAKSQNTSSENFQTQFFQIKISLNTSTEKIERVELLQTKIADVKASAPLHTEDEYDFMKFVWTDAEGKILFTVQETNPCLQHYEYANEKGELGKTLVKNEEGTLLLSIPFTPSVTQLKVYHIAGDGREEFVALFTNQNNMWK